MSDEDRGDQIIKRLVRQVLQRTLQESMDALVEQAAEGVMVSLQKECGTDRLYVPSLEACRRQERDERIRADFKRLLGQYSQRIVLEILERREALSIKQLRRICLQISSDTNTPTELRNDQ